MIGAAVGLVLGLLWVKGHTVSSRYFSLQQPVILRLAFQDEPSVVLFKLKNLLIFF